jgi:hypothetical protein
MLGIRPDDLLFLVMLTVGVAGLGWFIRMNHSDTRRGWWISRLTHGLTVGAVFAAGFVGLLLGWTPGKEWLGMTVAGGGFGFFTGLWGGRFVWKHYRKEIEGEDAG